MQKFLNSQEVAVPAAVVERGEENVAATGEGDQLGGLGRGEGHGLVDDDIFARGEDLLWRE